ncbi:MAG: hypothetical protein WC919_03710 [Candidatus Paceibacterota bacterium]|jgi:hypothetical protein
MKSFFLFWLLGSIMWIGGSIQGWCLRDSHSNKEVKILHAASVPVHVIGLGETQSNGRRSLSVHVQRHDDLRMYYLPSHFSVEPSDLVEYKGGPE